ncbi:hypothetical protein ACH5A2_22115 [Streptomyces collinus]|uniref:hypothetical protein n=1 Tax=Streptomyces collinus TaxID=42684 RepID=UPI0037B15EF4
MRCLAYLIVRREGIDPERSHRLGAAAYGPHAEKLTQDLLAHVDACAKRAPRFSA